MHSFKLRRKKKKITRKVYIDHSIWLQLLEIVTNISGENVETVALGQMLSISVLPQHHALFSPAPMDILMFCFFLFPFSYIFKAWSHSKKKKVEVLKLMLCSSPHAGRLSQISLGFFASHGGHPTVEPSSILIRVMPDLSPSLSPFHLDISSSPRKHSTVLF